MRVVLYTLFCLLLIQNVANAQNKTNSAVAEDKLALFFGNLTGYMNQRDAKGVGRFLKRHSRQDIELVKKIIKVKGGSEALEPEFEVEDITMTIEEYQDFLNGLFKRVSDYAINHRIVSVEHDAKSDTVFANVEFKEYATIREYVEKTGKFEEKKIYVNSNCTFSFTTTSGLPEMHYTNCVEKVVKN